MRISDLQHFIAVAEYGSLTHAAEVRGISQPGLSRIVRELEGQLGAVLLRRTGRGIELTAAGERFLEFARQTMAQYDQARRDIDAHSPEHPIRLKIAIPIGTGGLLAPDLQRRFALELPKMAVDVFEERTARATDAMLSRRYDIVLTYGYAADAPANGEDRQASFGACATLGVAWLKRPDRIAMSTQEPHIPATRGLRGSTTASAIVRKP